MRLGDHLEQPGACQVVPQRLVEGAHERLRRAGAAEIRHRHGRLLARGQLDDDVALLRPQGQQKTAIPPITTQNRSFHLSTQFKPEFNGGVAALVLGGQRRKRRPNRRWRARTEVVQQRVAAALRHAARSCTCPLRRMVKVTITGGAVRMRGSTSAVFQLRATVCLQHQRRSCRSGCRRACRCRCPRRPSPPARSCCETSPCPPALYIWLGRSCCCARHLLALADSAAGATRCVLAAGGGWRPARARARLALLAWPWAAARAPATRCRWPRG